MFPTIEGIIIELDYVDNEKNRYQPNLTTRIYDGNPFYSSECFKAIVEDTKNEIVKEEDFSFDTSNLFCSGKTDCDKQIECLKKDNCSRYTDNGYIKANPEIHFLRYAPFNPHNGSCEAYNSIKEEYDNPLKYYHIPEVKDTVITLPKHFIVRVEELMDDQKELVYDKLYALGYRWMSGSNGFLHDVASIIGRFKIDGNTLTYCRTDNNCESCNRSVCKKTISAEDILNDLVKREE